MAGRSLWRTGSAARQGAESVPLPATPHLVPMTRAELCDSAETARHLRLARLAGPSLRALLADQLNGGMLGEELEGECLHVADLWIEQDQRSAALVEQVCRAEQCA